MRWLQPERNLIILFLLLMLGEGLPLFGQSRAVELYRDAESAHNSGNYELATELFKASIQENPGYRDPYVRLAEILFHNNASEEALSYIETARRFGREDHEVEVLQSRILTDLGRFQEAHNILSALLLRLPYHIDALRAMGELEIAQGSLRGALGWYDRILEIDSDNRIAMLSSAAVQNALDRRDVSENTIVRAVELYPESFSVHHTAAMHFLEKGDLSRAEYHCDLALRIEPANTEAIVLYASILSRQERYETLLEWIRKHNRTGNMVDNHLGFYLEGSALVALERYQEALDPFSAVLRIRPDNQISRIVYEQLLSDKIDRQLPANRQRIEDAAAFHLSRASAFSSRNRLDRALDHIRRALRIDPDSETARKDYGKLWLLKGYPAKHVSIFQVLERQGVSDIDIKDSLEIYRHRLSESVSSRWGIDQFSLQRFRYTIPVYISREYGTMIHSLSRGEIATFIAHVLHRYEHISVPQAQETASFAEAYGKARALNADYFSVISLLEDEDSFTLASDLYSGRTGSLIERQRIYRTGNERVTDAVSTWSERLGLSLPPLGRIVEYTFSDGLIDLGRIDGIEEGEELLILPKEKLQISRGSLGVRFSSDDAVGLVEISALDELVSRGVIRSTRFYDLINPGDWVVSESLQTSETAAGTTDLEREGRSVIYSDIYKSVSNIR
jgi:tetratricopeptide (TPR) repeat protein